MQLKDFVAETLKELISGVLEAQVFAAEKGAMINPNMEVKDSGQGQNPIFVYRSEEGEYYAQVIEFDVAVQTSNDLEGEISGGISVISGIFNAGVKSRAATKDTNNEVNRVKFSIPVMFPLQKKVPSERKARQNVVRYT